VEGKIINHEQEPSVNQIEVFIPPSESLWTENEALKNWPELCKNSNILCQIKNHQELSAQINDIFDKLIPGKEITEAIDNKIINDTEAVVFFDDLSEIIKNNDNKRLVLYLPFELVPSVDWTSENEKLNESIDEFRKNYLDAWAGLFSIQDVRANFFDGDIIESELRKSDLPRVVKAAHFIPELINKGLIKKENIFGLLDDLNDDVLKKSINDVLPVMLHLGQITNDEFNNFFVADDGNNQHYEIMTDERKKWLTKKQTEEGVLKKAKEGNSNEDEVLIERIRLGFEKDKEPLFYLWKNSQGELRQRLSKTFRHFYYLGFIDKNQIDQLGVPIPNLSGKFSENLPFLKIETEKIKGIVKDIKSDSVLIKLIFPVILMGGSKVKGYGELDSDTDVSIFIRPGVLESEKKGIREKLEKIFLNNDFNEKPIEFWLEKDGDLLKVNNSIKKDHWIGENDWAYTLFNSFWIGDRQIVDELKKSLLPSFFYETDEIKNGINLRELNLENMQKDLLQYRLMHKGYEKHFPENKNSYKKEKSIDGQSYFWDSGYRQLATKLFINNIFLPKL